MIAFFHCEFILQFLLEMGFWHDAYRAIVIAQRAAESGAAPDGSVAAPGADSSSSGGGGGGGPAAAPAEVDASARRGPSSACLPVCEEQPAAEAAADPASSPVSISDVAVSLAAEESSSQYPQQPTSPASGAPRGSSLLKLQESSAKLPRQSGDDGSFSLKAAGAGVTAAAAARSALLRDKAAKMIAASTKAQQVRTRGAFVSIFATVAVRMPCREQRRTVSNGQRLDVPCGPGLQGEEPRRLHRLSVAQHARQQHEEPPSGRAEGAAPCRGCAPCSSVSGGGSGAPVEQVSHLILPPTHSRSGLRALGHTRPDVALGPLHCVHAGGHHVERLDDVPPRRSWLHYVRFRPAEAPQRQARTQQLPPRRTPRLAHPRMHRWHPKRAATTPSP